MEFLRRLYGPLLVLLIAAYAWHPIVGGDDFWAHAALGRWVLQHHQVPTRTLFLWSADVPWVFHSYLSGVWFALILGAFGPFGAIVWNVFMSVLPFALIWRFAAKTENAPLPSLFALFVALAVFASQVRFHLRPEMFSALFLTLTILFLARTERTKIHFTLVALMFALWPNLHAGVLLGIALLWIGALALSLQTRKVQAPLFALAAACSLLPWLCNPWGFGYLRVYSGTLEVAKNVVEWLPFWQKPVLTPEVTLATLILLGSSLVLQLLAPQRRWWLWGATLFLGALFLQSRRQLWLVSLVSLLGIATTLPLLNAKNLYSLLKRQNIEIPPPMRAIGRIGALLLVLGVLFNAPTPHLRAVSEAAPVEMSRFLLTKAPQGRVFNDYESSAALEWFLEGKRALYIDLINAYPAPLLKEYINIIKCKAGSLKILDEKKVDLIALRPLKNNSDEPLTPLAKYLEKSRDWKLVYRGRDGRVWHRVRSFVFDQPYQNAARQ